MSRVMTLAEAAGTLHETITVNTLRRAVRDGRLRANKLGTPRYYVTPEALEEFVKCPADASPRASTSATMNNNGSSEMAPLRSGLDMAMSSMERLKARSGDTSKQKRFQQGQALPIREN